MHAFGAMSRNTTNLLDDCYALFAVTFVCLRLAHQSEASSAATNADGSFRLCFWYCYCCCLPQRFGKTCFVVGRVYFQFLSVARIDFEWNQCILVRLLRAKSGRA